ncbi:hypothetical protein QNI19_10975 [Cytophagaceae bacterium DM2B3-1]|uniref:Uncharacterized protein n=1 Tax=Xanthocytophaga flava TaxID=3048013 RepID=A0ABT7CI96_9BACT|nr:hypothetical protein [Xanthocytophaga flavus]MDJ1493455.1 hypothetical protein [Xanthocytophaga flavus]
MIKIDDKLQNITFATAFLYFLALLRLTVYYRFFGLDIIPFLTVYEVIKSIFNANLFIASLLLFGIYLGVRFALTGKKEENRSEENSPLSESGFLNPPQITLKNLKTKLQHLVYACILNVVCFWALFIFGDFPIKLFGQDIRILTFTASMLGLLVYLLNSTSKVSTRDISYYSHMGYNFTMISNIMYIIFLVNLTTVIAFYEAEFVKKEEKNTIRFRTDNATVSSNTMNRFIGVTENYIILYNLKDHKTTLYSREEVKELEFKTSNLRPATKKEESIDSTHHQQ